MDKILTVGACRKKWKALKNSFTRKLTTNANRDFSKDDLFFLLNVNNNNKRTTNLRNETVVIEKSPSDESSSTKIGNNHVPSIQQNVSAVNQCNCTHADENLNVFFRGIANTMRTFSQLQIAELKLEISKLVGKVEIDTHKQDEARMYYSVDPITGAATKIVCVVEETQCDNIAIAQ